MAKIKPPQHKTLNPNPIGPSGDSSHSSQPLFRTKLKICLLISDNPPNLLLSNRTTSSQTSTSNQLNLHPLKTCSPTLHQPKLPTTFSTLHQPSQAPTCSTHPILLISLVSQHQHKPLLHHQLMILRISSERQLRRRKRRQRCGKRETNFLI